MLISLADTGNSLVAAGTDFFLFHRSLTPPAFSLLPWNCSSSNGWRRCIDVGHYHCAAAVLSVGHRFVPAAFAFPPHYTCTRCIHPADDAAGKAGIRMRPRIN